MIFAMLICLACAVGPMIGLILWCRHVEREIAGNQPWQPVEQRSPWPDDIPR